MTVGRVGVPQPANREFGVSEAPLIAAPADPAPLSDGERRRLKRGELVVRPMTFSQRAGRRYVGGLAYQWVGVEPQALLRILSKPENLKEALPRTLSVRVIQKSDQVGSLGVGSGQGICHGAILCCADGGAWAFAHSFLDGSGKGPTILKIHRGFFELLPMRAGA